MCSCGGRRVNGLLPSSHLSRPQVQLAEAGDLLEARRVLHLLQCVGTVERQSFVPVINGFRQRHMWREAFGTLAQASRCLASVLSV